MLINDQIKLILFLNDINFETNNVVDRKHVA